MDLEKKIMEEIGKKRKVEKKLEKLEEIKGKRETEWEEFLKYNLPMRLIEKVSIYSSKPRPGIIRWDIEIIPKKEYLYKFVRPKFETFMIFEEKSPKEMEEEYKLAVEVISRKVEEAFMKVPIVMSLESLARRMGRHRALEVYSYLCQRGSPFHCSYLYNYLVGLIPKIIKEYDKSIRGFLADYVYSTGFRKFSEILKNINPAEFDRDTVERLLERIKYELKEILGRYAFVADKPDDLLPSDIEETWKIANEACKIPEYKLIGKPYDESSLIEALKEIIKIEVPEEETVKEKETVKEVPKEKEEEKEEEKKGIEKLKEEILKRMRG